MLDSLAAHIAVLDCAGRIVATNRAWECFARDNGADPTGLYGVGADYLAVCRAAAERGDTDARAALAGIESVLAGTVSIFTLEYACHSADEQRWFALSATPMTEGAVVSHTDITARVQAEKAMHASEHRARESEAWAIAVFEHAAVGMAVESLGGRFLAVNDCLCRLLGYSREELLQLDWVAVTHPDERAADEAASDHLTADPDAVYCADKRYLRKDGSVVYGRT